MDAARFAVDPLDPRAPSQAVWDRMTPDQRQRVVDSLPSEPSRAAPPEGDTHRRQKTGALDALDEYFRRINRRIYLSSELPVYYPAEEMFAPDLLAVLEVEAHERERWTVSHEGRGLDFVLEIHVAGERRKDFARNVERYGRLGIPEYFAFDVRARRLAGWRLTGDREQTYEPIVPQGGRWSSAVLQLELGLEEGRLRFFHGSAALLDARELIGRLSRLVDDALERAEQEAQRAEQEGQRAEQEAQRAEQEAQRAERLAARLRELGIDPDTVE